MFALVPASVRWTLALLWVRVLRLAKEIKKQPPFGDCFFIWLRRQDSICIFATGKNKGRNQCLHWFQQVSTGHLLCYGFESCSLRKEKRKSHPDWDDFFFSDKLLRKGYRFLSKKNCYFCWVCNLRFFAFFHFTNNLS